MNLNIHDFNIYPQGSEEPLEDPEVVDENFRPDRDQDQAADGLRLAAGEAFEAVPEKHPAQ